MKQTPKTHKTRCGAPWRNLGVTLLNGVAIAVRHGASETILYINEDLRAYYSNLGWADETQDSRFDLIPIPKEHNLPTNLPKAARYAARDSKGVMVFNDIGALFFNNELWDNAVSSHHLPTWLYGSEMPADYEPEDSLHERTEDGGWRKAE